MRAGELHHRDLTGRSFHGEGEEASESQYVLTRLDRTPPRRGVLIILPVAGSSHAVPHKRRLTGSSTARTGEDNPHSAIVRCSRKVTLKSAACCLSSFSLRSVARQFIRPQPPRCPRPPEPVAERRIGCLNKSSCDFSLCRADHGGCLGAFLIGMRGGKPGTGRLSDADHKGKVRQPK